MSHTPEPWLEPVFANNFWHVYDIGRFFNEQDAKRARLCVNACAGMENPEEEIQSMREALENIAKGVCVDQEIQYGKNCSSYEPHHTDGYCPSCLARHTLKNL